MYLAQLSDTHLQLGPLGTEPAVRLHHALGRVLALSPQPDCVLITGDLVQHGELAEYQALREVIGKFPLPLHLLPGNHDDPATMIEAFAGTGHVGDRSYYALDYPQASVLMLNSHQPGSPAGRLGPEQLDWLDAQLASRADLPAFVCLHHPPVPIGIPFLDGMRLTDSDELAAVIGRHRQVVRILAGHVHRSATASFAGTTVSLAPSTYRQSALRLQGDQELGYLDEPTGFLLHWLDGSDCVSHLVPVSHASGLIGYF